MENKVSNVDISTQRLINAITSFVSCQAGYTGEVYPSDLAKYLINSGTVVPLPCELGTRVYIIIDEYDAKHTGCACCLADYGFKTKCEYYQNDTCTNTSQYKYRIISRRFELNDVYKFGKTVFLTSEEAEEELKEMLNKRGLLK